MKEREISDTTVYSGEYCRCLSSKPVEEQINDDRLDWGDLLRHTCWDGAGNIVPKGWVEYTKRGGQRQVLRIVK